MSEPTISIIIPVYNVEKYLRECLDSCINQTLEDIEIICVDDCSPDNSIKILEEYQQKDSRIKIFRHEKNKNLGAARNTGLQNATGGYVWFVDSDDYIDSKACQILYDAIEKFDVDLLCFSSIQFVDMDKKQCFCYNPASNQGIQTDKVYYPKTNWKEIKFLHLNNSACKYLVRRCAIQNFKFREGVWHEDADFTPILFSSVSSFCCISYTAYFRRIHQDSITQKPMSQKRLEDYISVAESLDEFIVNNRIRKKHFLYKYLNMVIFCATRLCDENPDINPENFDNLLKLQRKCFTLRQRLRRWFARHNIR